MSNTPLTDAAEFDRFPDDGGANEPEMVVDPEFARKLEMRLTEAENEIRLLRELIKYK
jgi:hypothetical protein